MKKKALAIIMTLILASSLAGCQPKPSEENIAPQATAETTPLKEEFVPDITTDDAASEGWTEPIM